MRLLAVLLLAAAGATPACEASAPSGGASVEEVREVSTPARPGSGEPHLAADGSGVVLSWLEVAGGDRHVLYMDRLVDGDWEGRRAVASGSDFFVNWADFPSVTPVGEGELAAQWLVRGAEGGYDYGIRVAFSRDGGRSWTDAWVPHEDRTPTEHGFVSVFPLERGRAGLAWLDGRDFAGDPEDPEMSLRFRSGDAGGSRGPETLVDARTCDCCQTDAAVTDRGPVLVYRDRSAAEVRDIRITRLEGGEWTDPVLVHDDGWVFPACPVNGPAVSARGSRVAVAWFTGADEVPRVRLAFSSDAGDTFAPPVRVDDGDPAGRVDVALLYDGSALVTWLERGGGTARLRVRRMWPDGESGRAKTVGTATGARSSGFPRMALDGKGDAVFAWTDDTGAEPRVRVARARIAGPAPAGGGGP